MNSSEVDPDYERNIVLAHHLSGAITLTVTIPVLFLIITGDDSRGKHYRKYLCYLVVSSLAYDQNYDNYAAIFLINKGLFYSDSLLSKLISAAPFFALAKMTFTQVIVSYFACVYYRRSNLLPLEYYWVKSKTTYLFVQPDECMDYANYVGNICGALIALPIIAMLLQLIFEVRKGMKNMNPAMIQYHKLAVRALILQGVVPSLTYAVPALVNSAFELRFCGDEEKLDRLATLLSPISVLILTKHTLVNSLTILACSPSYRKRITNFLASLLRKIIPPARVNSETSRSTH